MVNIRKSPFKVDKIENDPRAFGNRPKEVIFCIESLFNNRHVLISGPRGIGKSSLASQIQNLYKGDNTLAKRCRIETELDENLTCFYSCDKNTTLASLSLDLIFLLEKRLKKLPKVKAKKISASLDLGVIKASLEGDILSSMPSSIATRLLEGIIDINRTLINFTNYEGINILIDELDQLEDNINFGHFIKIVHEYLIQNGLNNINFIFAGQKGIFSKLYHQDQSVERIIKHVPISKLHKDECKHILTYASTTAIPPFTIEPDAEELILKLSSGFPYTIQLLGDAAFHAMEYPTQMLKNDVLTGVENIVKYDKNEKYYSALNSLSSKQRKILFLISTYPFPELPASIPIDWIKQEGKQLIGSEEEVIEIYNSLHEKGYIIILESKNICQFNDELFRTFLSLLEFEKKDEIYEAKKIEYFSLSDSSIKKIVEQIEKTEFKETWEYDEDNQIEEL